MKSVGCTLILAEDDWTTSRKCHVWLQQDKSTRTWSISQDSKDPRLQIGYRGGPWAFDEMEDGTWVAYLLGDDYFVAAELYGLSKNFMDRVTCGNNLSGTGWHQGPPTSDLAYSLWFTCV